MGNCAGAVPNRIDYVHLPQPQVKTKPKTPNLVLPSPPAEKSHRRNSSIRLLARSRQRKESPPRTSDTSEPPHTALLRAPPCKSGMHACANEHSMKCSHLPSSVSEEVPFHPTRGKNKANEPTPLASPFTRYRWYALTLFQTSKSFCQCGRWALQTNRPQVQSELGPLHHRNSLL